MESITISYSFFEPKSLHREMRTWDLWNNQDRYWYNIPVLMTINSIVYPEAKIKIHISKNILENPLSEILEKLSQKFPNVELVEMPFDYTNTEPTMWRYKPVFDKESDIILCRDIDSIPNSDEIKATFFFLQNQNYFAHTLRTHTNHVIPHTIMLAGLCGFRPKQVYFLDNINFEIYYNHFKNSSWGLDQSSLINMFVRDQNWTKERFLDSPISTQYHKVGNPLIQCSSINQDIYREQIELDTDRRILEMIDSETKWAGEPTNFRGEKLRKFLEIENSQIIKLKEIFEECTENTKKFYLVDV